MTVLPDHVIKFWSTNHTSPLIEPFNDEQLAPSSYDCKLAPLIKINTKPSWTEYDLRQPIVDDLLEVNISESGWPLRQGDCILAATEEKVNIPANMVCRIEGKSSIARLFTQIHSAGYIDPGFRGNVTLEIVHFGSKPVRIWPGILIAQLSFEWMSFPCAKPYQGRYQDSEGVVGSKFNELDREPGGRSAVNIEQVLQET